MRLSAAISTMRVAPVLAAMDRRRHLTRPTHANFRRRMSVAKVVKIWDETPTLLGVALASPAVEAAHQAPGQFITLSASTPVAIASAPGHGLELLVKKDGT